MAFDLIIFDCDGVLVDSETICNEVLAESLRRLGLHYSKDETVRAFVGRSMAACLELIQEELGSEVPSTFLADHQRRLLSRLDAEVEAVRGIEAVLDGLGVPCCVASSGEHEKMRTTLGTTGLLSRFEGTMFSAVDVARGKPAPDLFLHAASVMGAEPGRCAVIEDTVPGVRAGVAAGMTVFGYTATQGAEALTEAGARTFDRMDDLPRLLHGSELEAPA